MIARFFSLLAVAFALGFVWFAVALPGPADERATDGIVVLTGGAGRVDRGLALLAAGKAQRMLVSGADRRVRPGELAAAYRVPARLVRARVDLGRQAVDTRSNAEETAAWIARHRYRSIRLVTTDWHMWRARYELGRVLGDEVTVVPDGVPSEPGFAVLFAEYSKYVLRRIAAPLGL